MITVTCPSCGHGNVFAQPYRDHAGFADQGFLYNDAGNLTLVWSSFDAAYEAVVGKAHPWALDDEQRVRLERALVEAPSGGKWRFANSARCAKCASAISGPITEMIYYLRCPGSIDVSDGEDLRFNLLLSARRP